MLFPQLALGWSFLTHPQINRDTLDLVPPSDYPYVYEAPFQYPLTYQCAGNAPDMISVVSVRGDKRFDYAHNRLEFGYLMQGVGAGIYSDWPSMPHYNRWYVTNACAWLAHQLADYITHKKGSGYSMTKVTFPSQEPGSSLNHAAAEFGVDVIMYAQRGEPSQPLRYSPSLIEKTSELYEEFYGLPEGAETITQTDARRMAWLERGAMLVNWAAIIRLRPEIRLAMQLFYSDYYYGVNNSGGGYEDSAWWAVGALYQPQPMSEAGIFEDPLLAFFAEVATKAEEAGIIRIEEIPLPEEPDVLEVTAEITDEQAFDQIFDSTIDKHLRQPISPEDLIFARFLDGLYRRPDLSFEEIIQRAEAPPAITATIDINPDTLNLKSKGKWITCYIELPANYNVSDIDISTLKLNDIISAEPFPTEIGDYDNDEIGNLMVKFDRANLEEMLSPGNVVLEVTGEVAGTDFEGCDTIRVINKGGE